MGRKYTTRMDYPMKKKIIMILAIKKNEKTRLPPWKSKEEPPQLKLNNQIEISLHKNRKRRTDLPIEITASSLNILQPEPKKIAKDNSTT